VSSGRFSKSARRGAPHLFQAMFKDKTALYFPVKVTHPPLPRISLSLTARSLLSMMWPTPLRTNK